MKLSIIALLALLTSCGQITQSPKIVETDHFFDGFKIDWEYDTGRNVDHIAINFSELSDGTDARCNFYEDETHKTFNYIMVSRKFWEKSSDLSKQQVIYHELVHCDLLFYTHVDSKDKNSCPISIMSTYSFSANEIKMCYSKYREEYIAEMLTHNRN